MGKVVLRVRRRQGKDEPAFGRLLAEQVLPSVSATPIWLRMRIDNSRADFEYSLDGHTFAPVLSGADARVLTTAKASGFVGALVGMYAERGGALSD